jgi:hypothetical protein
VVLLCGMDNVCIKSVPVSRARHDYEVLFYSQVHGLRVPFGAAHPLDLIRTG